MTSEPADDNISQFMAITELDRTTAVLYLRGTNNDLWRAVDMAINGEPPSQQPQTSAAWNEGDWSTDRNGDFGQGNIPSFQIDVADDIPPYSSHSVAPSRPPSRNSQRSTGSRANPGDISMSGRESRIDGNQETGVISEGASAPYFGPATRSHYDASEWAMTISGGNDADAKSELPAAQRQRETGQLSFLKPSQSKDYLPALLTILNTIPLAHNTLLLSSHVAPDYGYDSEWWNGASMDSVAASAAEGQESSSSDLDIIHETQRLMAFLDLTDRAYGSVEALSRLKALFTITHSGSAAHLDLSTDFEKFLAAWEAAATKVAPAANIRGVLSSTATVNDEHHRFLVLPANLGKDTSFKPQTIYDVLDAKIFIEEWPNVEDDVPVITEAAKVFILKLKQPDLGCRGLDLDVPDAWYADRYLKENLPATKGLRQSIAHSKALIQHCEEQEQELSKYEYNGKEIDPLKLLQASMKAFRPRTAEEKEVFPRNPDQEAEEEARYARILKQLQKALDNVREKVDDFKRQREHTIEQLRMHSELFTAPNNDPETCPKVRYRLRGVATKPDVTYVLQPFTDPTVKDDDWTEQAQWWKIECRSQCSGHLEAVSERVAQSEVLEAARYDSKDVMLVYATDEALEQGRESLPAPLENFIKRDNHAFKQDLDRGADTSEDQSTRGAKSPPGWDDSQEPQQQQQPPPYVDYDEQWAQRMYPLEKTTEAGDTTNTTDAITRSEQSSSNESVRAALTPDTEMAEPEMKEREGSSLVGAMMSPVREAINPTELTEDLEMVDASLSGEGSNQITEGADEVVRPDTRERNSVHHIENVSTDK